MAMPHTYRVRRAGLQLVLALTAGCATPPAPVVPPAGPVLVVANQDKGIATLLEVQTGRVVAHIDVDMDPHEAAVSPDGRLVALASPSTWLGDARQIALVDVSSATHINTIDLGEYEWPHGVAFLDNETLLVSSREKSAVAFVDIITGQVKGAADNAGSRPYLLHLSADRQRAYTSNPESNTVTEIDVASRRLLRTIAHADQPSGFTVAPDRSALWVATWLEDDHGAVSVIDLASGSVAARFEGFRRPRRLAFSSDGARVVITDGDDLRVFDAVARKEIGRVHLRSDAFASGVVFAPDSRRCYVALSRAGALVEVDVDALAVQRRIEVGQGADGLAFVRR
jgi:DNA-binding beta-propeller fold protein YncE